ncbi:MAG: AbrB/MazE/SpoVT family DNA-binding domain-containing protein [Candidatus Woesearchaeota archaeon]
MKETDIVKMSDKGQLVVPEGVRKIANLNPGERFIAWPIGEGVVFKKVEIDFEKLTNEIEKQFKTKNITKSDINGAVRWARKK